MMGGWSVSGHKHYRGIDHFRQTRLVGAQKLCHVTASFRTSEVCSCWDIHIHCVRETLTLTVFSSQARQVGGRQHWHTS